MTNDDRHVYEEYFRALDLAQDWAEEGFVPRAGGYAERRDEAYRRLKRAMHAVLGLEQEPVPE